MTYKLYIWYPILHYNDISGHAPTLGARIFKLGSNWCQKWIQWLLIRKKWYDIVSCIFVYSHLIPLFHRHMFIKEMNNEFSDPYSIPICTILWQFCPCPRHSTRMKNDIKIQFADHERLRYGILILFLEFCKLENSFHNCAVLNYWNTKKAYRHGRYWGIGAGEKMISRNENVWS